MSSFLFRSRKMSEDEQLMSRLELITQKFQQLKLVVTEGGLERDTVEEKLDKLNQDFAAYIEDWHFLAEDVRKDYKGNYLGMQNDFHYVANLMLSQVKSVKPTEVDDPIGESRNLENQSEQSQTQSVDGKNQQQGMMSKSICLSDAAAQFRFGEFPEGNTVVSTTAAPGNIEPPKETTTEASMTSSTVVTTVNNASIISPKQIEPMVTDESEKEKGQPLIGVERLQVIVTDNPKDRAGNKPLQMPPLEKVKQVKSANGSMGRSFTSLSFAEKTTMFGPILELPKISKVDESTLNKYLVALTAVKENLGNMRVPCDKDTEHWIIMIVLGTLDESSLRWWKLLMLTAQPAIEVLSGFLATRVENLKAEKEPFKIPLKRSSSPESGDTTGKKGRSRSNSRSRPTGTKPKVSAKSNPIGNQPSSSDVPSRPDCRYCKQIGHVVANCPGFVKDSPEDRETNLFRKKLCFICLLPHQKGECQKANNLCPVCRKAHHPFLLHRQ